VSSKFRKKAGKAPAAAPGVAAKGKGASPAPKPSPSLTLAQLADSYLHHLEAVGKSEGTVRSYRGDLKVALRLLGAETKVADLTEKKVRGFFESDAVCRKRDGKPRNPITVAKQRRVLRLALCWLVEVGVLKQAPIPELGEARTKVAKKK